jgi:hypothetical protein
MSSSGNTVDLCGYDGPIHCPFCGHPVGEDGMVDPCEHTLFVDTSEGSEFQSTRYEKALEAQAEELEEIDLEALGFRNVIILSVLPPEPSGSQVDYGFAAME